MGGGHFTGESYSMGEGGIDWADTGQVLALWVRAKQVVLDRSAGSSCSIDQIVVGVVEELGLPEFWYQRLFDAVRSGKETASVGS